MPTSEYDPSLTRECLNTACSDSGVCLALEGAQSYFNEIAARRTDSFWGRMRLSFGMEVPVQGGLSDFSRMTGFTAQAYANNCPFNIEVNRITGQDVVE